MKLLIVGTGGVGGYYGARLAGAGNDVWFLARGRNLDALRAKGLRVRSDMGDLSLDPVQATDVGAEAVDAALVCVKTYDNESAAKAMDGAIGDGTTICSLQNGVDNELFFKDRFPNARVLAGVARIVAWLDEPGVIVQKGHLAEASVGAFSEEDTPAAESLAEAMRTAGIPAAVAADPQSALWLKLVFIASVGAMTAYCRCPMSEVLADPTLRGLMTEAAHEVATVAGARGISLPPGIADGVITYAEANLDPELTSSMARDVEAGRPLEVEALNGAVVRYGAETGVPTPASQAIVDVLLPLHQQALASRGG